MSDAMPIPQEVADEFEYPTYHITARDHKTDQTWRCGWRGVTKWHHRRAAETAAEGLRKTQTNPHVTYTVIVLE